MPKFQRRYAAFAIWLASLSVAGSAAGAVTNGQYKLPASVDPTVTDKMTTELWAHVWRPAGAGPYPLIVFLHGNHGTCGRFDPDLGVRIDSKNDYTFSGTCPSGWVVTPNHRGYDYLAKELADAGYVVVSINANRGVNVAPGESGDPHLIYRRGRLVLRHLQLLAGWNAGGGAPPALGQFRGLIDLSQIGMMGHSRGGEGVRAAVNLHAEPGSPWPGRIGAAKFKALFEIAPTDLMRTINPVGLHWNVLVPGCDADVEDFAGVRPFDRSMRILNERGALKKSTVLVSGANHNSYNTEWQVTDIYPNVQTCLNQTPLFQQIGRSPKQAKTATHTVVPFFRAYVGGAGATHPDQAWRFDPSYKLPPVLLRITRYARGFTPSPRTQENFVIDNFSAATGVSSRGAPNIESALNRYIHVVGPPDAGYQDTSQHAAMIDWVHSSGSFQTNAAVKGTSFNVKAYKALEFRVVLKCDVTSTDCPPTPDPAGDVDFTIALADSNDKLSSKVRLKSHAAVRRPAGPQEVGNYILQTVRIPLSEFSGIDLAKFRGVRFIFNRTRPSFILLANVRLTRTPAGPGGIPSIAAAVASGAAPPAQAQAPSDTNRVVAIRQVDAATTAARTGGAGPSVEIELASSRLFPVGGSPLTLIIGEQRFSLSRFPPGTTDRVIFTLTPQEFAALRNGSEMTVRFGAAPPWGFGPLEKPR